MSTNVLPAHGHHDYHELQFSLVADQDAAAIIARSEKALNGATDSSVNHAMNTLGRTVTFVIHSSDDAASTDTAEEWIWVNGEAIAYDPDLDLLLIEAGNECFAGPFSAVRLAA